MRKIVLLTSVLVLIVILPGFMTAKRTTNIYFVYVGSGSQKDMSQYTQFTTSPGWHIGNIKLYWFKIVDNNDGIITLTEFYAGFEALDITNTALNSLDDEMELAGVLEKRFP